MSLPTYSQHLLVLLFGTFRVIASKSEEADTGMTEEALGVSVAPSFFHTCITSGRTARIEDVERFKHATKVTSYFIKHFGMRNLFGRENYEYYARLTGRILRVEDEWIFFKYPWPEIHGVRDDLETSLHRTPDNCTDKTGSLEMIPENCPLDPQGRLSISLDDQVVSSPSSAGSVYSPPDRNSEVRSATLGRTRQTVTTSLLVERERGSSVETKSYTCLPQVHQRQAERMRARSDWFLSDPNGLVTVRVRQDKSLAPRPTSLGTSPRPAFSPASDRRGTSQSVQPVPAVAAILASEAITVTGKPPDGQSQGGAVALRRRLSDKDKERRLVRRSSSKRKDKENGGCDKTNVQGGPALKRASSGDSNSVHVSLSRTTSQDSPQGRHSRVGSFEQQDSHPATPTAATDTVTRALPRI